MTILAQRERVHVCRVCDGKALQPVVDLGTMAFTGWFPKPEDAANVPVGPLELLLCAGCGLVQLAHNYPAQMLYGNNYGYRSGLNRSMVEHLADVARFAQMMRAVSPGDVVVDIGGNDGTLLANFAEGVCLVNADPTLCKFGKFNRADVHQVPAMFSLPTVLAATSGRRAALVFSIAMFYDLPRPVEFAKQVAELLAPDGLWIVEVAGLGQVVAGNMFDGFCHEHTEYYSLETLLNVMDRAGLRPIHIELNDTNGGSIQLTVCRKDSLRLSGHDFAKLVALERRFGLRDVNTWRAFNQRKDLLVDYMRTTILTAKERGKRIAALGASTKGNVLLNLIGQQAAGAIESIGEVNSDKFGCVTPGTEISIVPEEPLVQSMPDMLVVLPWHFRDGFIRRLEAYATAGGVVYFPLPHPQFYLVPADADAPAMTSKLLN